jgi:hypothetical protein
VRSSSLTVHEAMEGVVDRVSLLRRPPPAASPAVEQFPDVVEVPAEHLLKGLDGVAAHVEDLLVDAERELRVSVAEQVHRAARGDAALGEDRRERAPQRVRRDVGHRRRYTKTLHNLEPGHRVFVRAPGKGYIGVGTVIESARLVEDVLVPGPDDTLIPLLDAELNASAMNHHPGDPDNGETVVLVDWFKTVALEDAFSESGLFGNQNSACKLRDAVTRGCPRSRRTLSGGPPASSARDASVTGTNHVREDRRYRHEEGIRAEGRHGAGGE